MESSIVHYWHEILTSDLTLDGRIDISYNNVSLSGDELIACSNANTQALGVCQQLTTL